MTTSIILAGGLGTRLRSAVPNMPKPMASIGGRPFLEKQMDYWIDQGVNRFVISVGYMKEVIMEYFNSSYRSIPLTYSIEDEPLGTGGALLLAAQGLIDPFLVLNGDTFFECDLNQLLKFHVENDSDWTFSLFSSTEVGRYMGIGMKDSGKIASLNSLPVTSRRLSNGGAYLVNPLVLKKTKFALGEKLSLEYDLLPALMSQGSKLFGLEFTGRFIDIGLPQDYLRAAEIMDIK